MMPLARRLRPGGGPPPGFPFVRRTGSLAGIPVLLAAGGMGARRAAQAAAAIIEAWRPDMLVVAGAAGALSPDLKVGDILVARAVETAEGTLIPPVLPPATSPAAAGVLVSLDRVLITPEEKRAALETQRGKGDGRSLYAVEMETAAAARVAAARRVPWAAIRAISDTAEDALPLDFNRLRQPDGDLLPPRVALAALLCPASIPGLIRLAHNTGQATEALALFLEQWITSTAREHDGPG